MGGIPGTWLPFYQVQGDSGGSGSVGTSLPIHAPQRAPGVLHDPVRRSIFLSIPHSEDGVVHLVRSVVTPWAVKKRRHNADCYTKKQPMINRGLAGILDCAPTARRTHGYSELQLWRAGREAKERSYRSLPAISEIRVISYRDL